MTIEERIQSYTMLATESKQRSDMLRRKIYLQGLFRLTLFVGSFPIIYALVQHLPWLLVSLLVIVIAFALSLKRHNMLADRKEAAESLLRIAENELKALQFDFSSFDGAKEKIDPSHPFSFDLDLFGEHSLFQQINRTTLAEGKERLATMLQYPLTSKGEILDRQQAIAELMRKEDFCLQFLVTGKSTTPSSNGGRNPMAMPQSTYSLPNRRFWKLAISIIPLLYLVYLVLWLYGMLPGGLFVFLYVFTLGLSVVPMRQVKATWLLFDKKSKQLSAYARLFTLLECEQFESPYLKMLQAKLRHNKKASEAIVQLSHYSRSLDLGFTLAVLILNPLFLWTTRYTLLIANWMKLHGEDTGKWFEVLAETDALVSMATFAVNHPDYTFPEIADEPCFRGEALGHPLLPRERCVTNDIDIARKPYFMIVTGANMAGKSTYLRTVGVNHLLASVALPVCAKRLELFPGRLLTNLRTSDSLVNSESYFLAELKRLKMIIDRLESGEEGLFIILDEILKGTNSEDKQRGSLALMKRLVRLGGNGIIATHDLALGSLEQEFPKEISNWHFDAVLEGDRLTFSYKLQEGIAQNMNASYLMRTMGITD